jgi:hypothetical protein
MNKTAKVPSVRLSGIIALAALIVFSTASCFLIPFDEEPETPTGLVTTGATVNSITLSWSSVSNADGYYVYRSSTATGTYNQVGSPSSASYTDTGLSSNTIYYYKVAAYNDAGTSDESDYIYAVTLSNATNSITITGSSRVGATLTASSTGTGWSSTSYMWGYADKADANRFTFISGATGSTYTVSSTYSGQYIRAFRLHPDGDWHRTTDNAPNYASNYIGPMQK